MEIREFAKISEESNWGGYPGEEFWPGIQRVYMDTRLTKRQVAWLYWMHTGIFDALAVIAKAARENVEKVATGRWSLMELNDLDALRAAERNAVDLCETNRIY